MENLGFDYGVFKQRIFEAVAWVEQTLIKDGTFSLPSKRELIKENTTRQLMLQNAKPNVQNMDKKLHIRVKKRHTIKDQIIINGDTKQIVGIYEEKGSVHDLEIFKRSKFHLLKDILFIGDKGYQNLKLYHSNSLTPYKKPKNSEFTDGLIHKFQVTEFASNT